MRPAIKIRLCNQGPDNAVVVFGEQLIVYSPYAAIHSISRKDLIIGLYDRINSPPEVRLTNPGFSFVPSSGRKVIP